MRHAKTWIMAGLALAVLVFTGIFLSVQEPTGEKAASEASVPAKPAPAADGAMVNLTFFDPPEAAPTIAFKDGDGRDLSLTDFRGKLLLVNFWATWCGPCRKEMPDLDALQAKYGGETFQVIALSSDRQGREVIDPFYRKIGVKHLAVYNDKTLKAQRAFKALGLPTTVLIDPQGRLLAKMSGPAEWNGPDAHKLIAHYLQ